ncbi:hypothetical protein GT347_00210 [Xylophilus rhododendri]|uniref:Uncharacterized protein n=1 Tax=Xylophilus rhododendri TaxID=2697032 RepID=A0A857J105_9BURK|nr:hypothetical protein [Xylophilus rhododendri]QHI96555.1 hypothetical protein GT347_00210 [Xylophilus rhododendri]
MSIEPPRFVPTLTEVLDGGEAAAPPAEAVPSLQALPEQLAHRVLQRVDALLEERLPDLVRAVVARHMDLLTPLLREEIANTVQASVAEALADELPASGLHSPV